MFLLNHTMYWKERAKRVYEFLFKEDTVQSNLAFAAVAFIFIKYVFLPFLGLITGTSLPVVAVISQSMYHPEGWAEDSALCRNGPCTQTEYYAERGIDPDRFASFPLSDGFSRGDILLLEGHTTVEVGDVVVYRVPNRYPVIHRVVEDNGDTIVLKGDNNPQPIEQLNEYALPKSSVEGQAYLRIPYVGYVKIFITTLLSNIV